ncbi:uncharacterized protein [Nicotiana tomentosiformis]|uniref:uncharacterized protein n=1 Tax=Nicotiana tomentosiformis TaxID=4098 RepID=UPI00388C9651
MSDEEHKRLERFGRLNPPSFSWAESEDAQDFLNRCQRILRTVGILETSRISFTIFQLTGAAFKWWEADEQSRPTEAAPLSWHEFSVLFLEKFVLPIHREELRRQFEKLHQEGMPMTQYMMIFLELAHHAIWFIPTERERIRRFIAGLSYGLHFVMTRENASGARFDEVVDIAWRLELVHSQEREEREAKMPHGLGSFSGSSCASAIHGLYSARPGQLSISAFPAQSSSRAPYVQGSSVPGLQTRVDLLLLTMVDFDVILGMDWLSPYHAILDCHAKTVTLAIPGLRMIKWRGSLDYGPSKALANQFVRLDDRMKEHQYVDSHMLVLKDTVQHEDTKDVSIEDDGVVQMQGQICVPNVDGLCELIREEAHSSRYSIHLGAAKM